MGTFTRANTVSSVGRVAHEHGQAERQVGDVGERSPRGDRERGQRREDHALEVPRPAPRAARRRAPSTPTTAIPCSASAGRSRPSKQSPRRPAQLQRALADQGDRLRGRAPVLTGLLHARVDLIVQARDPHHVVLVEVGRVDRAELDPLEQGRGLVLGELQHAVVEVQPGQLAVDVQRRVLQPRARVIVVEHLPAGHATPSRPICCQAQTVRRSSQASRRASRALRSGSRGRSCRSR